MKKHALFMALLLLCLSRAAVVAAPPGQDPGGEVYTVQKDDWLSKIAEKYYGDVFAYPVIVEATNTKAAEDDSFAAITNPDLIQVGQSLWIPDQAVPMVVELADGTQCLHAGFGATLAFDGKRLNYTCETVGEDEVGLLGDLQEVDGVTTAEKAVIGHDESGFTLKESELVPVASVSYTAPVPGLSVQALGNATYQGVYEEPVPLTEGTYTGEPFVEGGASRPTVVFADQYVAYGDLNGDGVEDAAVLLAENSGGSGVFVYLAAVTNQDGTPVNVATQFLGDRVDIKSVIIEDGEIVVNMITQGPDDPFCCPTIEVTQRYRLDGDQLVEQTGFAGTYTTMLPSASSPGRDITLVLAPDGSAELSTDYLNGEAPIVETGAWVDNGDGTATVTLIGRPDGRVYETPTVITFELVNGELVAVDYDVSLYGSEGLRLTKQ